MDLQSLPRIMAMLQQINSVAHDPDAAGIVDSASQLMAALEPLRQLTIEAAIRRQGHIPEELNWVMLMPLMLESVQQRIQSASQQGLSAHALDALPEIVLGSRAMERLMMTEGEAMCAICHEDYVLGQSVLQLRCGHLFCVDCGRQWLRRNSTCPCCRQEVQSDEEDSDEESGWHSQDLFPMRYAQGSPLAAVRRARQVQESGAIELWPPIEDAARIAEGSSVLDGEPQRNRRASERRRHHTTQSQEHESERNDTGPDSLPPTPLHRSHPASRPERPNRNSGITNVQRQPTNALASTRRDEQRRLSASNGLNQALPSLSPSNISSAAQASPTSRALNAGARIVRHNRGPGSHIGRSTA